MGFIGLLLLLLVCLISVGLESGFWMFLTIMIAVPLGHWAFKKIYIWRILKNNDFCEPTKKAIAEGKITAKEAAEKIYEYGCTVYDRIEWQRQEREKRREKNRELYRELFKNAR